MQYEPLNHEELAALRHNDTVLLQIEEGRYTIGRVVERKVRTQNRHVITFQGYDPLLIVSDKFGVLRSQMQGVIVRGRIVKRA